MGVLAALIVFMWRHGRPTDELFICLAINLFTRGRRQQLLCERAGVGVGAGRHTGCQKKRPNYCKQRRGHFRGKFMIPHVRVCVCVCATGLVGVAALSAPALPPPARMPFRCATVAGQRPRLSCCCHCPGPRAFASREGAGWRLCLSRLALPWPARVCLAPFGPPSAGGHGVRASGRWGRPSRVAGGGSCRVAGTHLGSLRSRIWESYVGASSGCLCWRRRGQWVGAPGCTAPLGFAWFRGMRFWVLR